MDCVLKDKNHLGHYLNSIYVISEQFRYGKNKRASSLSVSGKQKTDYKAVYEKTLENIDGMQKQFHRLKEVENESKSLRWKYDNLVLEKEKDCGHLRQLYEDSEKKQENYKNKARDLMEENLVLKRNQEDLEAYLRDVDYPNLNNRLEDALRKNEVYKNKSKDLLFSKQELEKRNHEQMQKVLQEKNYLNAQLEELEKESRELKKRLDQINEEKAALKDDYQQMLHHNNKNQDTIQKKNEEIAKLRNALVQNDKEKNQLSEISAKPVLRSLQTDGPVARKIHSNLLQSAPEKRTCINCRKLQEEINELRKDESDFRNTGFKQRPSSLGYVNDSYLKQKNELESRNKELQRKNQELAENLRSAQNDLYEYKHPFGKPTYAELSKMHEENKQGLNKSEEKVKIVETALTETQQKYSNLEENVVKLKEENEEKNKQHQKIQAEFENIQTTLRKTQSDLTEYKQREEMFKKSEAVLRKMCDENNQQLTKKETALKEIEATVKETQEKNLLLQKDNEKFLKEKEDVLQVKDLLKKSQASLKKTHENYLKSKENCEKLSKENEVLARQIEENQTALTQFKQSEDKLRNNESDLRKMREENKQLAIKEDNLKKTLQQKHLSLQQSNEVLTKENEELKKEIEESFAVRSKIEMELESMQKSLQETHGDLTQHKRKEDILKRTESEIKDLQEKFSNLEEKNGQLIKTNDDYLQDLRQYQTKYEDIQKELKTVRNEFEEYKRINTEEKKKEVRKSKEEDQIKIKHYNEREEDIKIAETTLKEREDAFNVKEEKLKKSLLDLKHQEETLQKQLEKINQRETEFDGKLKNILERETRIKEKEIAYHTKEEKFRKIEEDFEKSKAEMTVQITNLNEKYFVLQQEKTETDKTYQHLLKQFVQTQEELKKNKKALAKLENEIKKYSEEKEVLKQQCGLLETKLLKYEQSREDLTHDEMGVQNNKLEHQKKNEEEISSQKKLKSEDIKEETMHKQKENIVVLKNNASEEVTQVNKENVLFVRETDNKNGNLEEKVTNLTHENQNLLREKEQNNVQIAQLFQTGQRLQEEIQEVKRKLDESEKLLEKKTQETEKVDEERQTAVEKCNHLERRLTSISEAREDSLKKMTKLQCQVSVLKNKNDQLLKKKEEIEHELSSIQEILRKKNELTEEVSDLNIRIENLLEERREYFNTKEEFLQKNEVLRKENEQLCGKLKTTESTVQASELAKANLLQDSQTLKRQLGEILKKNSDLTEEIAKANQECSALKQEIAQLRNVYEEKAKKMEEASELSCEVSSLKEDKEKFEKDTRNVMQQLEGQIQEKDSAIENLNKLIREVDLKNKQKSEEEMHQLLVRLKESEAEFKTKENIFVDKEKEWQATESNLNEQLTSMKQEAKKIDQENKNLLQERETLKHEVKTVQHLHEKHRQEIEENFKTERSKLQNELVSLKDNNKKLENHLNAILEKNLQLENEIQLIKTDLEQYKNATIKPTFEELKTSLAHLEEQSREKTAILAEKDELLKEAKRKLEEIEALAEKNKTELRLKEEEFNTKINEQVKIEGGLQENAVILKQEIAELKGKVSQANQENELLKQKLETKRIAFEEERRKSEQDFKKEAHNLSNELLSLRERNQKLEGDLNDALQKKSKLENEVQVITNELHRYRTKSSYEDLSRQLTQLETQLKEKSAELENKNQLIEKAEIQAKNKEMVFTRQLTEISNAKTAESKAIIEKIKADFNSKIEEYVGIEKNLKDNIATLQQEKNNITERATKINQEHNELRQEQEILKLEMSNKKNVYDQQLQNLEELSRKETNDLKNKISSLESKNQKLEDDIKTSANKCLKLENYILNKLKPYCKKLEEELKEKDALLAKREKLIEEGKTRNEEMRKEILIFKERDAGLIKESDEKKEEYESLKCELENRQRLIDERKTGHEELLKEILILREANANLIKGRDAAIKEKINLLEEIETLKRELEAREIVYKEELNRYESTFRKEENDLRSRVSVLKRENGVLQREMDNVLEEKHRLEELTRTGQNNLDEEIARLTQQLEERNVKLDVTSVLIKDLNVSSKKQAQEFGQMLSVKEEENRKLDRQIQEMREILRSKEVGFKNKMEMSKNEISSLPSTAKEETKRISDDKTLGRQNLTDLKGYYENEILILKRNVDALSREKEEITKERDALLSKQQKLGTTQTSFNTRQSAVLTREFEQREKAMQQKISLLKHVNQSYSKDFEIMKKEMEMLVQKNQDVKNVAERDDVKIQLENRGGVQHPIFKNISSTITSIGYFEELAAKLNPTDLKQIHDDLKKQIMGAYGKKVRNLDLSILKLVNQLDDADIRKQNDEFKRQLKLKNEEIEKLQSVFAFPDTIRKTRSAFEDAISKILNETTKDLVRFKQSFSEDGAFEFQTVIAQINGKYEEIIVMLSGELNRLQQIDNIVRNDISDMPKEISADEKDTRHVRESLEKINEINRNTRELEIRVVKFRGNKEDKTYLDLNHKLLENIMKTDVIQVNGSEKVRERRKEAIKYASKCMEKLEANVES